MAKLNEEQIVFIRQSSATTYSIAKRFNVTTQLISLIRKGKIWRHVA